MPARLKNINAFDLKFLKALLNLKINGNFISDLSTWQKRDLCKSYNIDGVIELHHDYLNRIWTKNNGISHSVTHATLDQFCNILKNKYRWYQFTNDILTLRPAGIADGIPYFELSESSRKVIDDSVQVSLLKYKNFVEFEKEIIDKIEKPIVIREEETDLELKKFASKIYIELVTRKAGIPIDEENDVIEEIYNSWYKLFCVIRDELKLLPPNYLKHQSNLNSAVRLSLNILNEVLRPHLTEYQAKYRAWLKNAKENPKYKNLSPQELQKKYPNYNVLMKSLKQKNKMIIEITEKLMI